VASRAGTTDGAAGRGGGEGPRTRDHLANVRTLLAWLRVAIALLAVGYSVDRLGLLEARAHLGAARPDRLSGVVAAAAGTLVAAAALARYLRQRRAIEGATFRTSLLADVAMMVLLGGGGLALVVVVAAVR
jgi:putative membrane protein